MIIVDTPVWIAHMQASDTTLETWLNIGEVIMHPFVIGELACGELKTRAELLQYFNELRQVSPATHNEVMGFIESEKMMCMGVGFVDMHLLAAARLGNHIIWTHDKRLRRAATHLKLALES